jgi:hypothetical protein
MNERIRLLAEQAGIHDDVCSGCPIHELEKFAELIVFECIKLSVFKGDATTGKAIKEHFGVEE